jgi:hypothetical protein
MNKKAEAIDTFPSGSKVSGNRRIKKDAKLGSGASLAPTFSSSLSRKCFQRFEKERA